MHIYNINTHVTTQFSKAVHTLLIASDEHHIIILYNNTKQHKNIQCKSQPINGQRTNFILFAAAL